jgi:hypothetical protein
MRGFLVGPVSLKPTQQLPNMSFVHEFPFLPFRFTYRFVIGGWSRRDWLRTRESLENASMMQSEQFYCHVANKGYPADDCCQREG